MIASLLSIKKMSLIESITVENLDYLGIVAGLIDEIGIVELINQKLGVDNREKIATGQLQDLRKGTTCSVKSEFIVKNTLYMAALHKS